MKPFIRFSDYLKILKFHSNRPLSLNRITLPFGVISDGQESDTLLVGHVLDDLATRIEADAAVDCIDVLAAAYELGHEQAGPFLDEAPIILARMAKAAGFSGAH